MKVLGIVGSRRKLGNTEILVKEALKVARQEGAEVSITRLSDLSIQECNGCMACVISGQPCRLKDDVDWLVEQFADADGVVVGAPSYLGFPPGVFKTLMDRLVFRQLASEEKKKWGVSIGVAGGTHIAWWVVPMLNVFIRVAGFELLESFIAGSQGPGEVLLNERKSILEEVSRLSRDLIYAVRGETDRLSSGAYKLRGWNWASHGWGTEELYTVEDCCPHCFGEAVTTLHGDSAEQNTMEVECAFCHNSTGQVVEENGRLVLRLTRKAEAQIKHNMLDHMKNWVQVSGPLFQQRRDEIQPLRKAYKDVMPWLNPPSGE